MTLGFIVRATLEGGVWVWTLQDLAEGGRHRFRSFDDVGAAIRASVDERRPAAVREVDPADPERP